MTYDTAPSRSKGVTRKFRNMTEVYRVFSKDWEHLLDYSEQSLLEMYHSESYGDLVSQTNGFYVGKKYLNVTVKMWKEDIQKGCLFVRELYDDPKYPHWWLNNIFGEQHGNLGNSSESA